MSIIKKSILIKILIFIVTFLCMEISYSTEKANAATDGKMRSYDIGISGYQCYLSQNDCKERGLQSVNTENNTVTLKNMHATDFSIRTDNMDSIVYLKGDNYIMIDERNQGYDSTKTYGMHFTRVFESTQHTSPGSVTITGDEGATLTIIGSTQSEKHLFGIYSEGNITINDKIKINIILTDTESNSDKSIYGIYTLQQLTSFNNNISITIATTDENDQSNYYGIRGYNLVLSDTALYSLDIAEHNGRNIPYKTDNSQPTIANATASLAKTTLTLTPRTKTNYTFSKWTIVGTENVDGETTESPLLLPTSSLNADSFISAIYDTPEEPEPEPIKYAVLSTGSEDSYDPENELTFQNYIETNTIANNYSFILRIDASPSKFVSLQIDNNLLSEEYYDIKEGSTIIKLSPSLLSTLETREHLVTVNFDDGYSVCVFSIVQSESKPNTPTTTDENQQPIKAPETGVNSFDQIFSATSYISIIIGIFGISIVSLGLYIKQ